MKSVRLNSKPPLPQNKLNKKSKDQRKKLISTNKLVHTLHKIRKHPHFQIIATLTLVLILIGGAVGVWLGENGQDLRQQASYTNPICSNLSEFGCQNVSSNDGVLCTNNFGQPGVCTNTDTNPNCICNTQVTCTPPNQCLPVGGICCSGGVISPIDIDFCPISGMRCDPIPTPTPANCPAGSASNCSGNPEQTLCDNTGKVCFRQGSNSTCTCDYGDPQCYDFGPVVPSQDRRCVADGSNTNDCAGKTEDDGCFTKDFCGGLPGVCKGLYEGLGQTNCVCVAGGGTGATRAPTRIPTSTFTPIPTDVVGFTPPPNTPSNPTNTPVPPTKRPTNTSVPVTSGPTNTPVPLSTDTPTPTFTATTTFTPTRTQTNTPTNTPSPTRTITPTNTFVPVITNTAIPSPTNTLIVMATSTNTFTPRPTNTSVPVFTNTPVPVFTNTPVPNTPGQPTNTPVPVPTNTSVPAATNTSVPLPTATPVVLPKAGSPVFQVSLVIVGLSAILLVSSLILIFIW